MRATYPARDGDARGASDAIAVVGGGVCGLLCAEWALRRKRGLSMSHEP